MMLACLMAAALAFSQEDAAAAFKLTEDFVRECTPRDAGTSGGEHAAKWLQRKASVLGGNVYFDRFEAETPNGVRKFVNLHCSFERNPLAPWTVLVSHYDTKPGSGCPGANDGASTSCLMVQLVQTVFDNRSFDRNVMFIWTDAEECIGQYYSEGDGFQGSKQAAEMLRKKKLAVDAVYVLDMLGDRDLKICMPKNVSKDIAKRVVLAARDIGMTRRQLGFIDQGVLDDHVAFDKAGFRSVDLIDFEYGSGPGLNDYWHTPKDTVDKLSVDSFLTVGRLVCALLSAEKAGTAENAGNAENAEKAEKKE